MAHVAQLGKHRRDDKMPMTMLLAAELLLSKDSWAK